jgi:thymidylate synthase (FAD)
MKIIKPSVELLWITPNAEKTIELAGRVCYKSESKITEDSASKFCKMLIKMGHLAMIEHGVASLKFITDRGISHQLVRHRLCSFAQESTKINYKDGIQVIEPPGLDLTARTLWERSMLLAESAYKDLILLGYTPLIARSVLPTCLKTEIIVTANFREWLKIFELRISKYAHPQIQEVMIMAKEILKKECPSIFEN